MVAQFEGGGQIVTFLIKKQLYLKVKLYKYNINIYHLNFKLQNDFVMVENCKEPLKLLFVDNSASYYKFGRIIGTSRSQMHIIGDPNSQCMQRWVHEEQHFLQNKPFWHPKKYTRL